MASQNVNCPLISLEYAVFKIQKIYEIVKVRPATKLDIARAMQYGNLHGTSYTVINALIEYGLLEEINNDQLKLSERALDILSSDEEDPKRVKAIWYAAFAPSLFNKLHDKYDNTLPDDAELMTSLTEMGLHPHKVSSAIRAYRDTLKFVNEETKSSSKQLLDELNSTVSRKVKYNNTSTFGRSDSFPSTKSIEWEGQGLLWRIAQDCEVQIRFKGYVTQEALRKLVALLQLSIDDYPSKGRVDSGSVHQEESELVWRIAQDCEVQIRFKGYVTQEALRKLVALLQLSIDDYPSKGRVDSGSVH